MFNFTSLQGISLQLLKKYVKYKTYNKNMNLTSSTKIHQKNIEILFNALLNVSNYETLMPDNISKFEVLTEELFAFQLSGMPEIKLKLKENNPFSKIVLGAASDKLPFELVTHLNAIDENNCEVHMTFEGDFNPMMAMMIKGPINKLMETLVENMGKL
jgi:hypothetical protein